MSRVLVLIVLIFWLFTESYWRDKYPIFASFLFLTGTFLVGIAGMGRVWCSIYIAGYKNRKLIEYGPYSIMRNPLYFFSMLGTVGVGFLTETLIFPTILLIIFSLYYPIVIKREEKDLINIFGEDYKRYKDEVPAFFPRFSQYKDLNEYSVNPSILKKHIMSAVWFIWIIGVIYFLETLKNIFLHKNFNILITLF